MEEKKKKVVNTTITRNTGDFSQGTENIYETVAVLTKRANQIAAEEKRELHNKIDDFIFSPTTLTVSMMFFGNSAFSIRRK